MQGRKKERASKRFHHQLLWWITFESTAAAAAATELWKERREERAVKKVRMGIEKKPPFWHALVFVPESCCCSLNLGNGELHKLVLQVQVFSLLASTLLHTGRYLNIDIIWTVSDDRDEWRMARRESEYVSSFFFQWLVYIRTLKSEWPIGKSGLSN